MKNSKKGFTLVELIIVVAVIALLAAVLIPTFSSLISKANQAKDEALVSNLNKAVALSTEKYDNVHDVLEAVKANAGFDVAKISASVSEHEILWDSVNYCFVYKTTSGIKYLPDSQTETKVEPYQYWQFLSKEMPAVEEQKYSIYWAGAELEKADVAVGFDAGEANVKAVNYTRTVAENENGIKVVIRTKGGTLNVNAPKDSVYHYNKADKVVITAVYDQSYHLNGEVGEIELTSGRAVVESGSVNTVRVVADDTANVSVVINEKAKVNAVAATNETVAAKLDEVVSAPANSNTTIVTTKVGALPPFAVSGLGTKEAPYIWMGAGANKERLKGIDIKGKEQNWTLEKWVGVYAEYGSLYIQQGCDIVANTPSSNYLFQIDDNGELHYDLAGHTLTVTAKKSVFFVYGYGIGQTVSLELNDTVGTGKILFSSTSTSGICTSVVQAYTRSKNGVAAKIVINGGTYEMVSTTFTGASPVVVGYGEESEVNGVKNSGVIDIQINGGSFSSCTAVDGSGNSTVLLASKNDNSQVVINGGYFETAGEYSNKSFVLNMQDGWAGKITVNGGTYKNYVPGDIEDGEKQTDTGDAGKIVIGDGYRVVDNGDNTYSVVKK